MSGADYDTELFVEIANASASGQRLRIESELVNNETGIGLDGRALELVSAAINADGELYTDGECLDLIGEIVDIWRATDLDA
jgi:hypothetical protein